MNATKDIGACSSKRNMSQVIGSCEEKHQANASKFRNKSFNRKKPEKRSVRITESLIRFYPNGITNDSTCKAS